MVVGLLLSSTVAKERSELRPLVMQTSVRRSPGNEPVGLKRAPNLPRVTCIRTPSGDAISEAYQVGFLRRTSNAPLMYLQGPDTPANILTFHVLSAAFTYSQRSQHQSLLCASHSLNRRQRPRRSFPGGYRPVSVFPARRNVSPLALMDRSDLSA